MTILDLIWTLTAYLSAGCGTQGGQVESPLSGIFSVSSLCMYLIFVDSQSAGAECQRKPRFLNSAAFRNSVGCTKRSASASSAPSLMRIFFLHQALSVGVYLYAGMPGNHTFSSVFVE